MRCLFVQVIGGFSLNLRVSRQGIEAASVVAERSQSEKIDMPAPAEAILRTRVNELTPIAISVGVHALPIDSDVATRADVDELCRMHEVNQTLDALPLLLEVRTTTVRRRRDQNAPTAVLCLGVGAGGQSVVRRERRRRVQQLESFRRRARPSRSRRRQVGRDHALAARLACAPRPLTDNLLFVIAA